MLMYVNDPPPTSLTISLGSISRLYWMTNNKHIPLCNSNSKNILNSSQSVDNQDLYHRGGASYYLNICMKIGVSYLGEDGMDLLLGWCVVQYSTKK